MREGIKEKGFDMKVGVDAYNEEYVPTLGEPLDFSKIKVGAKVLDNPLTDINFYKKVNPKATRDEILKAIKEKNVTSMRELSKFFYDTNGIYARLCRYLAYIYRYDWYVLPMVYDQKVKKEKILEGFHKSLMYIDNFNAKKVFGEIALKVIYNGCYYGYQIPMNGKLALQELPVQYCRSRFSVGGIPVVELNMKYFDDTFADAAYRIKVLKVFPTEIQKGYILYKEGKLPGDYAGDAAGWFMLDYTKTVKFNVNGEDTPVLISVLPALIDLAEAKELDKKKMEQQLLKIIVQKMPMDKNGELIFDVDEARALHNNAVAMLGKAIGIDVLTTFADVESIDMTDRSATSQYDETSKVERAVFNEAGVSQQQFNTDGNLALEKSIANDEASVADLLYQFESFLNLMLNPFNGNPKKLIYKVSILPTTIYNYKELSKLYKEQMQVGFSKFLPQVALGQSQSAILASAYFENEVLNLNELFQPPASSATTPGKASGDEKANGRPPLPDDKKSDKTIKNKEAMG